MSWDYYVSAWAGTHQGYDPRHAGPIMRRWLHAVYQMGGGLARIGVRPGHALFVSAACAVAVPVLCLRPSSVLVAAPPLLLAGMVAAALYESLAVLRRRVTRLEMLYRTMTDRLSELCWLAALMVLGAHPVLALACAALTWLHEYVRAQARVVGLRAAGSNTVGDRPMRFWLTLCALVLAVLSAQIGLALAAGVVTLVLAAWLLLAVIGFGQLFSIVRRALG